MALIDRFFEKFGNKPEPKGKTELPKIQSSEPNPDEDSSGLFLDAIGDFAPR